MLRSNHLSSFTKTGSTFFEISTNNIYATQNIFCAENPDLTYTVPGHNLKQTYCINVAQWISFLIHLTEFYFKTKRRKPKWLSPYLKIS